MTAREAAETALNVFETLVASAVKQLAQDVLQDIFSEITQANYGAPGINAVAASISITRRCWRSARLAAR